MISPKMQQLFVILFVLIIVGFLAYRLYSAESFEIVDPMASVSTELSGQDVMVLIEKLNSITLDKNIFSTPLFSQLVDFSQSISPEPIGRPNPFATIGFDAFTTQFLQTTAISTTTLVR